MDPRLRGDDVVKQVASFPPFWAIPAFANEDRAGAVQANVTKLSITRLRPAVSKSISSLLPSIAAIVP